MGAFRSGGYSHFALACDVAGETLEVREPAGNRDYLVASGRACGDLPEGTLGRDSRGDERPSAEDLGRTPCP